MTRIQPQSKRTRNKREFKVSRKISSYSLGQWNIHPGPKKLDERPPFDLMDVIKVYI
jgi:hypothetical protein